ncbi:hypothetical protein NDU88_003807 [Pleurodeles waltl]|uniref:Uncharacterized protein n=1 Tax=Pleurodeles waltl TaxID=8319 RepID=A0AAV7T6D2_PLEWA|nr:hypothetical protein NDU88_003807 [Pleurodeles waltl]
MRTTGPFKRNPARMYARDWPRQQHLDLIKQSGSRAWAVRFSSEPQPVLVICDSITLSALTGQLAPRGTTRSVPPWRGVGADG